MFKIDMKEQSKKLVAMLDAIVETIDDWEKIVPVLRGLGQRHVAYGVKEQHYNTLCSAVVWAFGQALQPGFDDEVRAGCDHRYPGRQRADKMGAADVPSCQHKPKPAIS